MNSYVYCPVLSVCVSALSVLVLAVYWSCLCVGPICVLAVYVCWPCLCASPVCVSPVCVLALSMPCL